MYYIRIATHYNMIKFKKIQMLLSLGLMVFTFSCGDDEGSSGTSFSLNGIDFSLEGGIVSDYGAVDYVGSGTPTHYNYDFSLFDGTADVENEIFTGSVVLYAELLSFGTEAFQNGTFEFIEDPTVNDIDGENYFRSAFITIDGNGNSTFFETSEDVDSDLYYVVTDGSISVTNNGNNNFTITYNITVKQADWEAEELINGTEEEISFSTRIDLTYLDFRDGSAGRIGSTKRILPIL